MKICSIYEAILTKAPQKFRWNEFIKLSGNKAARYATESLRPMGHGSSRATYRLTSKKVLKIANDKPRTTPGAGKAQNEAEVNAWTTPNIKPIVTRIYDFDPEYEWIVSELVHSIKSKIHLVNKYFGADIFRDKGDFEDMIHFLAWTEEGVDEWLKEVGMQIENENAKRKLEKFMDSLFELQEMTGTAMTDLADSEHFGMTTDGRLVILDYGYTQEIGEMFY